MEGFYKSTGSFVVALFELSNEETEAAALPAMRWFAQLQQHSAPRFPGQPVLAGNTP